MRKKLAKYYDIFKFILFKICYRRLVPLKDRFQFGDFVWTEVNNSDHLGQSEFVKVPKDSHGFEVSSEVLQFDDKYSFHCEIYGFKVRLTSYYRYKIKIILFCNPVRKDIAGFFQKKFNFIPIWQREYQKFLIRKSIESSWKVTYEDPRQTVADLIKRPPNE